MLTVSLHKICIHNTIGLYPEEKIIGNDFEIDVDISVDEDPQSHLPILDYTIINQVVREKFIPPGDYLETFAEEIYTTLKNKFPQAASIKIAIRKLAPPMEGKVAYAQVCLER